MDRLNEAYVETVTAVTESVTDVMDGTWGERLWRRIVVNYETLPQADEPQTSSIAFAVAQAPGGPLEIVDFRLSRAARRGFERIAAIMHASRGTSWTVCDLTVEPDGRYDFAFSYGQPYRLGGHLHDTRFDDYLQRYLAEGK